MTGDLLQTDIDLAKRLIAAGEADEQILKILNGRKVPIEKAWPAIQDLRNGLEVHPDPEPQPAPSLRSLLLLPEAPESEARPTNKPSQIASHSDSRLVSPMFLLVAFGALAVAVGGVLFQRHGSQANARRAAQDPMVEPPRKTRAKTLEVAIEPQKVRVSGNELSRENALQVLSEAAGPPSRTNHFEDLTIYAFDPYGAVLYSGGKSGQDSLLLYFEPIGGDNGARNPFSGALTLLGNSVTIATTSKSLSSLSRLELTETATNVFSGKCEGLALSFAYLKTPDRLSLVQIDLP